MISKRLCLRMGLAVALMLLALQGLSLATHSAPDREGSAQQPVSLARDIDEENEPVRAQLTSHEVEAATGAGLMPAGAKSILTIRRTLRHGEFVWDENDVPQGQVEIWVDLRRQTISVFRAGHEIGSAIIAYGAEDKQTPIGKFEILSKHRQYRSRSYGADMPYSLFITNDGIALHSSVLRPRHATHGCIGLPEGFAQRLFAEAGVGALVKITRSDPDALKDLVTPA